MELELIVSEVVVAFIPFIHVSISICRYRLSLGCNDKLQLGSLIASFTRARSDLVAAAK